MKIKNLNLPLITGVLYVGKELFLLHDFQDREL
jgi:hypothetical protein